MKPNKRIILKFSIFILIELVALNVFSYLSIATGHQNLNPAIMTALSLALAFTYSLLFDSYMSHFHSDIDNRLKKVEREHITMKAELRKLEEEVHGKEK